MIDTVLANGAAFIVQVFVPLLYFTGGIIGAFLGVLMLIQAAIDLFD